MKKIVKSVKKVVSSKSTPSASAVSPAAVASVPAAAAAAPAVVTTMTDPAVQECSALLDQVVAKLGDQPALDGDQVRRATKMRKGGAEVIPKILALCQQHGITQIGTLTTQEMSDELARGDALGQVGLRSAVVQKKVKESAMAAHGRSWQIGTTMYTTLRRMAVDDPELAMGLESVRAFFQTVRTKGKVRVNKKESAAKKVAKEQTAQAAAPVAAAAVEAAPVAAPAAPVAMEAAPASGGAVNGGAGSGAAAATAPAAVSTGH